MLMHQTTMTTPKLPSTLCFKGQRVQTKVWWQLRGCSARPSWLATWTSPDGSAAFWGGSASSSATSISRPWISCLIWDTHWGHLTHIRPKPDLIRNKRHAIGPWLSLFEHSIVLFRVFDWRGRGSLVDNSWTLTSNALSPSLSISLFSLLFSLYLYSLCFSLLSLSTLFPESSFLLFSLYHCFPLSVTHPLSPSFLSLTDSWSLIPLSDSRSHWERAREENHRGREHMGTEKEREQRESRES